MKVTYQSGHITRVRVVTQVNDNVDDDDDDDDDDDEDDDDDDGDDDNNNDGVVRVYLSEYDDERWSPIRVVTSRGSELSHRSSRGADWSNSPAIVFTIILICQQ